MTTERIREIQNECGLPQGISIQQALLKVWNETEQDIKAIQMQAAVKPDACGKWQKEKPTKPCYFVHRYKKADRYPSFFEADIDTDILCVFNIQDDQFSCTMEEFVDEGEFYIIER